MLDLVKQKGFYPNEHMGSSGKFKRRLSIKEKFYTLLAGKKLVAKSINIRSKFGIHENNESK